jgi:hypothetical protein
MRFFSSVPSSLVRRPSATALSTRSLSAFLIASLKAWGCTPSCFAASSTIALLSALGESPSFVAAMPAPAPPTASAAAAPAITLRLTSMAFSFRSRVAPHRTRLP